MTFTGAVPTSGSASLSASEANQQWETDIKDWAEDNHLEVTAFDPDKGSFVIVVPGGGTGIAGDDDGYFRFLPGTGNQFERVVRRNETGLSPDGSCCTDQVWYDTGSISQDALAVGIVALAAGERLLDAAPTSLVVRFSNRLSQAADEVVTTGIRISENRGLIDRIKNLFKKKKGVADDTARGVDEGLDAVPCCFVAGTPVKTVNGYKNIEALKIGDAVLSWNVETGAIESNIVTDTHIRPISEIKTFYKLTIGSDKESETLFVTGEHPFWVRDKKEWVTVDDLAVGAKLTNHQGEALSVQAKELQTDLQQTYNITVAGNNNYFAGHLETLVHNCSPVNPKIVDDKFLKRNGIEPHAFKDGVKANSKQDIYVDRNSNVFVANKNAPKGSEFEYMGHLNDFK